MRIESISKDFGVLIHRTGDETAFELNRSEVIDLFKSSGIAFFKGFDVNLEGFNKYAGFFSTDYMTYKGGGYIRKSVDGGKDETLLSTSYDYGREKQDTFGLPLHGEMYYVDSRPVVLWFYCVTPAASDGETTICDGAQIYQELSPKAKDLFHAKRLKYVRKYLDGEWQKIYQTDDIREAKAFCEANGLRVEIDSLTQAFKTEYIYPAVIKSMWNDHSVYINNILPVMWQESMGRETSIVRFEDGSKIPQEVIDEVVAIQSRLIVPIAWQKGDFVMIDNTRCLHGRRAFSDTNREVYLRMVRSVNF